MITKFQKFNESKRHFVGIHCSPKQFNDEYDGRIIDEYHHSFENILKLIQFDYPKAQEYLKQISELDDVLSTSNDSVDLVFDIESFFDENDIEWIYVAPIPLTKYGENCYKVYFDDLSKVYAMPDELIEDATIYVYDSKVTKPILEEI